MFTIQKDFKSFELDLASVQEQCKSYAGFCGISKNSKLEFHFAEELSAEDSASFEAYFEGITEQSQKVDLNRIRAKLVEIRAERDARLADTDWLMVVDSPASEECVESYKTYRQALRELPENITDVDAIIWPVKPVYIAKV